MIWWWFIDLFVDWLCLCLFCGCGCLPFGSLVCVVLVLLLLIVRCAVMLGGSLFWVGYAVDLVFCFWFRCYFW